MLTPGLINTQCSITRAVSDTAVVSQLTAARKSQFYPLVELHRHDLRLDKQFGQNLHKLFRETKAEAMYCARTFSVLVSIE